MQSNQERSPSGLREGREDVSDMRSGERRGERAGILIALVPWSLSPSWDAGMLEGSHCLLTTSPPVESSAFSPPGSMRMRGCVPRESAFGEHNLSWPYSVAHEGKKSRRKLSTPHRYAPAHPLESNGRHHTSTLLNWSMAIMAQAA